MVEKIFNWLVKTPKTVDIILKLSNLDRNVVLAHIKTILIVLAELYLLLCIFKTQI